MADHTPTTDRDVLDGWKAIADYLGKSVRTAQRWRNTLGLPVHNMGGREAETVFAYRSEVDAWRRRAANIESEPVAEETGAPGQDNTAEPRPRRRRTATLVTALVAVIAVLALLAWRGTRPGPPARYRVINDTLMVFDADGRPLWQHTFAERLDESAYLTPRDSARIDDANTPSRTAARALPMLQFVDLEGDGHIEVLFIVRRDDELRGPLVCFSENGTERWRYLPPLAARYGEEKYSGPLVYAVGVLVTREPGGGSAVWVTFDHQVWFSSVLVKLDAKGTSRGEYWSNGRISSVSFASAGGRPRVFVGSPNNETGSGALAVLDREHFGGVAPAIDPTYRCSNCPGPVPEYVFLFPRTELARVHGGHATVLHVVADANGLLTVGVLQAEFPLMGNGYRHAATLYTLDRSMTVRSAEYYSHYGVVHDAWAAQGLLDHPFDATREAAQLWPVLRWDGTRFRPVPVPPG